VNDGGRARLRSLDVFRGATVALMILVNNPGSWSALYPPLAHAPWHGCTPTDLVFPFFLFAVGNALALVMPGLRTAGAAVFWPRVLKRTAWILALGLLLNAAPFVRWSAEGELVLRSWETLRLMGVLQRIALCFGAAAALVWWLEGRGGVLWAAAALLLGYWAACLALGAPGDPYSLQGWFGTAVDRALLGTSHLYRGEGVPFDPEGLASTAPAIAQVLLGWWAGRLMAGRRLDERQVARLMRWGAALLALGWIWQLGFPLNKKIWTSSYVLHTTGAAMLALGLCVQLVDIRARPRELWGWARFFEVFGRNPLFIFVLSGLVPRVLGLLRWSAGTAADGSPLWTSPLPALFQSVFAGIGSDPRLGSFLFATANLGFYAALAFWMDARRWYLRV
jgi:predicted acyltransferase